MTLVFKINIENVEKNLSTEFYLNEDAFKKLFIDEVFTSKTYDAKNDKEFVMKDVIFNNLGVELQ